MNDNTPQTAKSSIQWTPKRIKLALILVAALLVYLLVRPTLQSVLGIPLPGLFPDDPVVQNDPPGETNPAPGDKPKTGRAGSGAIDLDKELAQSDPHKNKPPVDPKPPKKNSTNNKPANNTSSKPKVDPKPRLPEPAKLGELTDLGRDRFESTAGLVYVPTRSEHRIEHVMRHAKNDTNRPVHGVFISSKQEVVLSIIDEAFLLAQKARPPTVEIEEDRDRTVYTIDLGRKIGYMGGQAGARKRNPPCNHLQLVLEGNEVITAYPVIPR